MNKVKKLLLNVIKHPRSTAKGLATIAALLSFRLAPEYIETIIVALGSIYAAYQMLTADS